ERTTESTLCAIEMLAQTNRINQAELFLENESLCGSKEGYKACHKGLNTAEDWTKIYAVLETMDKRKLLDQEVVNLIETWFILWISDELRHRVSQMFQAHGIPLLPSMEALIKM